MRFRYSYLLLVALLVGCTNIFSLGYDIDEDFVAQDAAALSISFPEGTVPERVMSDIELPSTVNDASVRWSSSNPKVVSHDGKVTRPAFDQEDVDVTLTATVRQGDAKATKSFDVRVLRHFGVWYYATSGSGTPPVAHSAASDNTATLAGQGSLVPPTGAVFAGWNSNADAGQAGPETWYAAESTLVLDGDLHLYVQWAAGNYSISYHANDEQLSGTVSGLPQDTTQYEYGDAVTLGAAPTLAGHSFLGWSFTPQNGEQLFAAGSTLENGMPPYNIDLYARWAPIYTVTFNPGPGSFSDDAPSKAVLVVYPATTAALPEQPSKADHGFAGWYTQQNGGGTLFTESTPVTGDITVYAHYSQVAVTFHTFGRDDDHVVYLAENEVPTRPTSLETTAADYEFKGWYQNYENGVFSNQYDFDTGFTANTTLYAKAEYTMKLQGSFTGSPDGVSTFIEWAKNSENVSDDGTLSPAALNGQSFSFTVETQNPTDSFYFRAVATNDAGRSQGKLQKAHLAAGRFVIDTVYDGEAGSTAPGGGALRVGDYGTGTGSGGYYFRGYSFEVTVQTTVTHLIGAATNGSTVSLVLYEANDSLNIESEAEGTQLLAHANVKMDSNEYEEVQISNVTLETNKRYIIAQGVTSSDGTHVTTPSLNRNDLLGHPRIAAWGPRDDDGDGGAVHRWGVVRGKTGDDDNPEKHILDWEDGKTSDVNNLIPRLGFLFVSDAQPLTVETLVDIDP